MKHALIAAALGLFVIGGSASAAPAPAPSTAATTTPFKRMKLTEIEAALKLSPDQKPLWDTFTGAIRNAGKARHDAYLQSRAAPKDLPSRLAQQEKMYGVQQKTAQDEEAALAPLWAKLDDQQRALLNDQLMVSYRRAPAKRTTKPAAP